MRHELEPLESWRGTWRGIFKRYGVKQGSKITVLFTTILLMDPDEGPHIIADHIWANDTLGMQQLGDMEPGQAVEFDARVEKYRKGSIARGIPVSYDYRLSRPTQWKLIDPQDHLITLLQAIEYEKKTNPS